MTKCKLKQNLERRKNRVRNKIKKISKGALRLTVFKSNMHIRAQIIDDVKGITIAAASTLDKDVVEILNGKSSVNINAATVVVKILADKAVKKQVSVVVFDRGGYKYHGRVKALADAAREGGLKF
jgi:large subunit ribosomal protein L18